MSVLTKRVLRLPKGCSFAKLCFIQRIKENSYSALFKRVSKLYVKRFLKSTPIAFKKWEVSLARTAFTGWPFTGLRLLRKSHITTASDLWQNPNCPPLKATWPHWHPLELIFQDFLPQGIRAFHFLLKDNSFIFSPHPLLTLSC